MLNLASSEAAQVRLAGSENGLQATDGPLPWPRTRDDVRGATQRSVVPRSARRLASSRSLGYDAAPLSTPSTPKRDLAPSTRVCSLQPARFGDRGPTATSVALRR